MLATGCTDEKAKKLFEAFDNEHNEIISSKDLSTLVTLMSTIAVDLLSKLALNDTEVQKCVLVCRVEIPEVEVELKYFL